MPAETPAQPPWQDLARIRILAEKLKSRDSTDGNLEGVLAVALLDVLDELDALRAADAAPTPPQAGGRKPVRGIR